MQLIQYAVESADIADLKIGARIPHKRPRWVARKTQVRK
jgi:hypothetical protein